MDETNEKILTLAESVLTEAKGKPKTDPPNRPMKPGRKRTGPVYVVEFVLKKERAVSSWQDPEREWLKGTRTSDQIAVMCRWLNEKTNFVKSGELGTIFVHSDADPEYAKKLTEKLNSYYANHWIICDIKETGARAIDVSSIHLAPDQLPPPAPKPPPPEPGLPTGPQQMTLGI